MKVIALLILPLLICACAGRGGHTIDPKTQGIPGKSLDTIAARIEKNTQGEDRIGAGQDRHFSVYMLPMVDEDGHLCDEGLVTLKGGGL